MLTTWLIRLPLKHMSWGLVMRLNLSYLTMTSFILSGVMKVCGSFDTSSMRRMLMRSSYFVSARSGPELAQSCQPQDMVYY